MRVDSMSLGMRAKRNAMRFGELGHSLDVALKRAAHPAPAQASVYPQKPADWDRACLASQQLCAKVLRRIHLGGESA